MNMAPISASAADDMKNLMTWEIVNMGPFHIGIGSSSAMKTWAPAWLHPLDSLRKLESECTASTIFLSLYTIPLLG